MLHNFKRISCLFISCIWVARRLAANGLQFQAILVAEPIGLKHSPTVILGHCSAAAMIFSWDDDLFMMLSGILFQASDSWKLGVWMLPHPLTLTTTRSLPQRPFHVYSSIFWDTLLHIPYPLSKTSIQNHRRRQQLYGWKTPTTSGRQHIPLVLCLLEHAKIGRRL